MRTSAALIVNKQNLTMTIFMHSSSLKAKDANYKYMIKETKSLMALLEMTESKVCLQSLNAHQFFSLHV